MAKGSKSCEPPEVWWGSNPFGTQVDADGKSQLSAHTKCRRAIINEGKSHQQYLRDKARRDRVTDRIEDGFHHSPIGMVKLVKKR